jgi:hypothetical protein
MFSTISFVMHFLKMDIRMAETCTGRRFTTFITLYMVLLSYLMFVPCIIKLSRKNQHNAQICTTISICIFYVTQTDPEAPWRWQTTAETCRSQHMK